MNQQPWVMVRHGETEWNRTARLQGRADIPLNATGRAQALATAEALAESGPWDLVVSSTLGRARETARIIARRLDTGAVVEVPALVERGYGPEEGTGIAGLSERAKTELMDAGESSASVVLRGTAALAGLASAHAGRRLVVVSHGMLIRLVLSSLHGVEHPRVENGEIVELDAALVAATRPVPRALDIERY